MKPDAIEAENCGVQNDSERLDIHCHMKNVHLLLIDEIVSGLDDVAEGRVRDACLAIRQIKSGRVGTFLVPTL